MTTAEMIELAGVLLAIAGVWARLEVKAGKQGVRIDHLEDRAGASDTCMNSLRESIEKLQRSVDRLITIEELKQ